MICVRSDAAIFFLTLVHFFRNFKTTQTERVSRTSRRDDFVITSAAGVGSLISRMLKVNVASLESEGVVEVFGKVENRASVINKESQNAVS